MTAARTVSRQRERRAVSPLRAVLLRLAALAAGCACLCATTAPAQDSVGLSPLRAQRLGREVLPNANVDGDDFFAFAFAVGDFDGDGADDLATGAPTSDGREREPGRPVRAGGRPLRRRGGRSRRGERAGRPRPVRRGLRRGRRHLRTGARRLRPRRRRLRRPGGRGPARGPHARRDAQHPRQRSRGGLLRVERGTERPSECRAQQQRHPVRDAEARLGPRLRRLRRRRLRRPRGRASGTERQRAERCRADPRLARIADGSRPGRVRARPGQHGHGGSRRGRRRVRHAAHRRRFRRRLPCRPRDRRADGGPPGGRSRRRGPDRLRITRRLDRERRSDRRQPGSSGGPGRRIVR